MLCLYCNIFTVKLIIIIIILLLIVQHFIIQFQQNKCPHSITHIFEFNVMISKYKQILHL